MKKTRNSLLLIALWINLVWVGVVYSTDYYVDGNHPQANDSNSGTEASPWRTIQRAANVMVAGDTCYVKGGTYEESIRPSNSGTSGNLITFAAWADNSVITRQFNLGERSFIRVVGFEITHNSTSFTNAIIISGGAYNQILNNNIHHVRGKGVRGLTAATSYNIVRGNIIRYTGCPNVTGQCSGVSGETGMGVTLWGHYNLIEYNTLQQCADFINMYGSYNIIRNNYFVSFSDAEFPDGNPGSIHADIFQPVGIASFPSIRHIYESNFAKDNVDENSHYLQMRVNGDPTTQEILFRGNVGSNFGSYALQAGGVDYVRYYNNTLVDMNAPPYPENFAFRFNTDGGEYSQYNHMFNNIFYVVSRSDSGVIILVESGNSATTSDNLCYSSGTHSSCDSYSNPLFTNYSSGDFTLQAGSPAISAGKAITTITSATGSGTSFNVADANFFTAGYGLVLGDKIKVGSNNPVRITSISSNTITVGNSISWNNGDGVYWRNQDTSPDIGAYEYKPGGYSFNISIASPQSGSVVSGMVTVQANVTNPDNVRMVIFYVDGVPKAMVYESPYTFMWNTSGLQPKTYNVTATAYSYYADSTLTRNAESNLTVNPSDAPAPPRGLQIIFRQES